MDLLVGVVENAAVLCQGLFDVAAACQELVQCPAKFAEIDEGRFPGQRLET